MKFVSFVLSTSDALNATYTDFIWRTALWSVIVLCVIAILKTGFENNDSDTPSAPLFGRNNFITRRAFASLVISFMAIALAFLANNFPPSSPIFILPA